MDISSSGVAAFIGFESIGAPTLHTLSCDFDPGDATGTQGIEVCSAEVC